MKRSMSESELLRLADLNLVEFWCESAKCIPNSEIVQCQDTVFINSGLEVPHHSFAFNLAVEPGERFDGFLARAKAFFAERKPAFSLMLRATLTGLLFNTVGTIKCTWLVKLREWCSINR